MIGESSEFTWPGILLGLGIGLAVWLISLAVSAIVAYLRRPVLVLEWGDGKEFDRNLGPTELEKSMVGGGDVRAAHAKVLRVREQRGRAARDVQVVLTSTEPCSPNELWHLPTELIWLDNNRKTIDIPGHGSALAALQRIVFGKDGTMTYTPAVFSAEGRTIHLPGDDVAIELELRSENAKKVRHRLVVTHPWPYIFTFAPPENPLPSPFIYPSVRRG